MWYLLRRDVIPAEKGNSTNVAQCVRIFSKWKQSLEEGGCLKRTIKEQGRCLKRATKLVSEKTCKGKVWLSPLWASHKTQSRCKSPRTCPPCEQSRCEIVSLLKLLTCDCDSVYSWRKLWQISAYHTAGVLRMSTTRGTRGNLRSSAS